MKSPAECSSIEEIRNAIDALDREIVEKLGLRFQYVKAITRFKKTAEDVRAPARRQAVLDARRAWAVEAGLDPNVVEEMYNLLIDHFVAVEMESLGLPTDTGRADGATSMRADGATSMRADGATSMRADGATQASP